jgi:hypothetical protein
MQSLQDAIIAKVAEQLAAETKTLPQDSEEGNYLSDQSKQGLTQGLGWARMKAKWYRLPGRQ